MIEMNEFLDILNIVSAIYHHNKSGEIILLTDFDSKNKGCYSD